MTVPGSDALKEAAEVLAGRCLCEAVAFEVWSPFLRFAHCFCRRCRKATGTGHATNLYCSPERFRWLSGEALVHRYDLPSARSFATVTCRTCGSPLPRLTRSGREIVVPAGSLDTAPSFALAFRFSGVQERLGRARKGARRGSKSFLSGGGTSLSHENSKSARALSFKAVHSTQKKT